MNTEKIDTLEGTPTAASATDAVDALERPVPEAMFVAFRKEIAERIDKMEAFIEVQKRQEATRLRDTALDVPKDVKIGAKTYKLHRLPAGYRRLMMERLQRIAELVPSQEGPPVEKLVAILQNKDARTPEELADDLLAASRQPGLLSRIAPHVPDIFHLMLEVIQLAFQANKGKAEFDEDGRLKNAVVSLETLEWECEDVEGIFNSIMDMALPIFFTIQSVQRTLAV